MTNQWCDSLQDIKILVTACGLRSFQGCLALFPSFFFDQAGFQARWNTFPLFLSQYTLMGHGKLWLSHNPALNFWPPSLFCLYLSCPIFVIAFCVSGLSFSQTVDSEKSPYGDIHLLEPHEEWETTLFLFSIRQTHREAVLLSCSISELISDFNLCQFLATESQVQVPNWIFIFKLQRLG